MSSCLVRQADAASEQISRARHCCPIIGAHLDDELISGIECRCEIAAANFKLGR